MLTLPLSCILDLELNRACQLIKAKKQENAQHLKNCCVKHIVRFFSRKQCTYTLLTDSHNNLAGKIKIYTRNRQNQFLFQNKTIILEKDIKPGIFEQHYI